MADQDDVRRIALALPDVSESSDRFGFGVLDKGRSKGFAWAWNDQHRALRPVHQSVSGAAEDKLRDRPPPPRPHHEQVHVRRELEQ